MGLAARHLEASGIPTVIVGSARDIVEQCAVPRFLFTDFPLGNPVGPPDDAEIQRGVVALALDLLAGAFVPMTTVTAPYRWSDDETWRSTYMEIRPVR